MRGKGGNLSKSLWLFLLFVPLSAAAPAAAEPGLSDCAAPAKRMAKVELIFGGSLSPARFGAFLDREITPRFPDGLSIFDGYGQWRGKAGRSKAGPVKESSRLLVIWYERGADTDAKIEAIRAAYKKRFHQDSVLRADEASCVSF